MLSLKAIESLTEALKRCRSTYEKIALLDEEKAVADFLKKNHPLHALIAAATPECEAAIKQLIALGQAPLQTEVSAPAIRDLLVHLVSIDEFYRELGGIAGYQLEVLRLLEQQKEAEPAHYHSPSFIDISEETPDVLEAIEKGIEAMPYLAEMYPLGGAADRLHLVDEKTGEELPAAKLQFNGKSLLEGLLRDLEARELLYYRRTNKVLTTPVAIMTSHEKANRHHVQSILEENNWFGRPKETFRLFVQPLVPVVDGEGRWRWSAPWKPVLKPGGHGAIWKLAKDNGIFEWLRGLGARVALIRQINNPLAGLDYGLLAFLGIGSSGKEFGFASCPRLCLAAEGVNVLIERKTKTGGSYALSNIEYCDFTKYGIEDRPLKEGEPYSRFTSNTNILFADLEALESAVKRCPFPGLLMNLKKDASGTLQGRLESTMQNIADVFTEESPLPPQQGLKKTFITYNARHKTISTAKKAYSSSSTPNETPENCFYDLQRAHRELLERSCSFSLPAEKSLEQTLQRHPAFRFAYHPALGPLFRLIGKKLCGGSLAEGSELVLDLAEVKIERLAIAGSLKIKAEQPLGKERFTGLRPRCSLRGVRVENRGVDWERSRPFWKGNYTYFESAQVILKGRAELIAEDVVLQGDLLIVVNDGERIIWTKEGMRKEPIPLAAGWT